MNTQHSYTCTNSFLIIVESGTMGHQTFQWNKLNMFVCVCAHTRACVCTHACACMHVCVYVCDMPVHVCVHAHASTGEDLHVCAHPSVRVCVCVYGCAS